MPLAICDPPSRILVVVVLRLPQYRPMMIRATKNSMVISASSFHECMDLPRLVHPDSPPSWRPPADVPQTFSDLRLPEPKFGRGLAAGLYPGCPNPGHPSLAVSASSGGAMSHQSLSWRSRLAQVCRRRHRQARQWHRGRPGMRSIYLPSALAMAERASSLDSTITGMHGSLSRKMLIAFPQSMQILPRWIAVRVSHRCPSRSSILGAMLRILSRAIVCAVVLFSMPSV